jgi:glycosyltransferase involved in cell wall biosynthesis
MSVSLSLVIPLHNEEPNVERLLATVPASLEANPRIKEYEIICVDDGSTDRTRALLEQRASPNVRIVPMAKRRGQSGAIARGLAAARHEVVGTLDGDLQTTPDDLATLLERLEQGYDCVQGVRVNRKDPAIRRWSSAVARSIRHLALGDRFRDIGCPLIVFRRECLEHLPLFDPFHRYLPFLIELQGFRVDQVPVRHFPRAAGRTKYGIWNRWWIGLTSLLVVRWLARHRLKVGGGG